MKRLDLTGRVINEFTVLGFSHSHVQPSGQKRAMWNVRCSCGVEKKISTGNLLHSDIVSCGHVGAIARVEARRVPKGQAAFNYLYLAYKHSAKGRGYVFNLSKEEFKSLIDKNCHYCGDEPRSKRVARVYASGEYIYNGIDRVDNSIGYELYNCVPCCPTCNTMKMSMSVDQMLTHMKKVIAHVETRLQPENHQQKHLHRDEKAPPDEAEAGSGYRPVCGWQG